ncbi:MAG: cytochrome c [Deltaproteobacteria bacterium]|nr:cytochrome c [Deltaproteobacteria bacterium]
MKRISRAKPFRALILFAACSSKSSPPPPGHPPQQPAIDRAALLAGKLPETAPEMELVNAQCRICHGVDYLTQQRLSEPAWKKTIEKMTRFGANLDDAQIASLAAFAARYWNPELPGRTWTVVPPPAGALPD